MLKRIIASLFLIELFIALGIYLIWQSQNIPVHTIELGSPFISFMSTCSRQLEEFKIEIPNIPNIPKLDTLASQNANWWDAILNFFVAFVNGFFTFLNGVVQILNFVITILNVIIQLFEFIFILIRNFFTLKDTLAYS